MASSLWHEFETVVGLKSTYLRFGPYGLSTWSDVPRSSAAASISTSGAQLNDPLSCHKEHGTTHEKDSFHHLQSGLFSEKYHGKYATLNHAQMHFDESMESLARHMNLIAIQDVLGRMARKKNALFARF